MSTQITQKATDMPSYRGNAIAVGVLFILCSAASILSIVPLGGALVAPVDLATLASNDNRVVMTALIEFVWAATGAGIAVALYPVLRKFNPALALGSVAGRLIENVFVLVGTLSLLVLLTLSQQAAGSAAASALQVTGDGLVAARDWVHGFVAMIPFGAGAFMYYVVLYRSRLIPRWLSIWGLVAIVLFMVATVYAGFTQEFGFTTINTYLNIPIGLQEMALAIWLLAKGFDRTALAAGAGSEV